MHRLLLTTLCLLLVLPAASATAEDTTTRNVIFTFSDHLGKPWVEDFDVVFDWVDDTFQVHVSSGNINGSIPGTQPGQFAERMDFRSDLGEVFVTVKELSTGISGKAKLNFEKAGELIVVNTQRDHRTETITATNAAQAMTTIAEGFNWKTSAKAREQVSAEAEADALVAGGKIAAEIEIELAGEVGGDTSVSDSTGTTTSKGRQYTAKIPVDTLSVSFGE